MRKLTIVAVMATLLVGGCASYGTTGGLTGAGIGAALGEGLADEPVLGALGGGLLGHIVGNELDARRQQRPVGMRGQMTPLPPPSGGMSPYSGGGNPGVEGAYSLGRGQNLRHQQRLLEQEAYRQGLGGNF